MKKIVLLFLTATTLFACKTNEVKTETAASATGTVTTTGPDVDLIKKSITAFANGDWATYASTYADTAKSVLNGWASTTDTSVGVRMPVLIEGFLFGLLCHRRFNPSIVIYDRIYLFYSQFSSLFPESLRIEPRTDRFIVADDPHLFSVPVAGIADKVIRAPEMGVVEHHAFHPLV